MPAAPVPTARQLVAEPPLAFAGAERERPVAPLWEAYHRARGAEARQRLLDHYMPALVRRIAQHLHARLPRQVDVDDLVQEGYFALLDTIERFDPLRHVRFDTFASQRIAGAMRDYLRRIDPVPRMARQRQRERAASRDAFFKRHGRPPAEGELADPPSPARPGKPRVRIGRTVLMATSEPTGGGAPHTLAGDQSLMLDLPHGLHGSPLSLAEREDLRRWVTAGFARTDRLIIILYYYEHLTMKEIGRAIGCSESRVSQRLEVILASLRSRLERLGRTSELRAE
jgi:RNA polymerase sigma factor for flagellar operon FliA